MITILMFIVGSTLIIVNSKIKDQTKNSWLTTSIDILLIIFIVNALLGTHPDSWYHACGIMILMLYSSVIYLKCTVNWVKATEKKVCSHD